MKIARGSIRSYPGSLLEASVLLLPKLLPLASGFIPLSAGTK